MMDLRADPMRIAMLAKGMIEPTNVYVRALREGKPASVDICELDKMSLTTWLLSRGGDNPWAVNTVGILLGHGHLIEGVGPHVVVKPQDGE